MVMSGSGSGDGSGGLTATDGAGGMIPPSRCDESWRRSRLSQLFLRSDLADDIVDDGGWSCCGDPKKCGEKLSDRPGWLARFAGMTMGSGDASARRAARSSAVRGGPEGPCAGPVAGDRGGEAKLFMRELDWEPASRSRGARLDDVLAPDILWACVGEAWNVRVFLSLLPALTCVGC